MYFANPTQPGSPADAAKRAYERSLDQLDDLIARNAADDEIEAQRTECSNLLELFEAASGA